MTINNRLDFFRQQSHTHLRKGGGGQICHKRLVDIQSRKTLTCHAHGMYFCPILDISLKEDLRTVCILTPTTYTFISLAQEKEINEFWQTCFELVGFCCRSVTIIVCSRLQDIDNAMNQNKAYFYKFGLMYVWRSVYNLYQKVNPLNINLKTIFQTLQSDNSQAITK